METIDLNCDLGESFGAYVIGQDEKVIPYVSSVNIACGWHAGDPLVMARTIQLALKHGIAIGAHPGFNDLMGFGRRELKVNPEEFKAYCLYQIGALDAFVKAQKASLQHVKLHGAMYNMAATNEAYAEAFIDAVASYDANIAILGLSGSLQIQMAKARGMKAVSEVFADRAYDDKGQLVNRSHAGAVIHDRALIKDRVLQMAQNGTVNSISGKTVALCADSICVHGDHPEAVEIVAALRGALTSNQIDIKAFGRK